MDDVTVKCALCEGVLFMLTCHHAHGTNHDWALAGVCVGCHTVVWTDEGCPACRVTAEALEGR